MKITDWMVLEYNDPAVMEDRIGENISAGWQPHGDLIVKLVYSDRECIGTHYFQVMTKGAE